METATEKPTQQESKKKDGIYVPKATLDKVAEMADVLGWSKNQVWAKAIDATFPMLGVWAEQAVREKQRKLDELRARSRK
jgi:hypothetical protein